ncbi:hypothetical protein [Aquirufa aurantiipilula]|uniref:DNA-directed RNA polymerase n=1 Tax=Aquirufa aurantiipilula TaxID=2696561 RepID=A0ABT6BNF3_9BACT|nr:hypothetical protein [Aquirufa aurantiipilula]MDF5691815.1 hypothetical protein [Aquirufa aurantiipilula]
MAFQPKYGYYPSNLDLEKFCIKNNLPANKVVRILNLFIRKPLGQEDSRGITLNSKILRRSVGDIYKKILECLLVNGVIENTVGYEIGNHSREYQLADEYYYAENVGKHLIEISLTNKALDYRNKERIILKFIEDYNKPRSQRTVDLPIQIFDEDYKNLIKWFKNGNLTIDSKKAFSKINELNIKEKEPHKYLHYLAIVNIFEEKDYHLKSDLNHRLYSSITNLPKFLRGCLRYDGEELIGIDVSNTQPLLLSIICDYDYLEELYVSSNIDVRPRMLVKFLKHLKTSPSDLKEYKKMVESGNLYESFIDIDPKFDRSIIKENLIKIINDKGINGTKEKKLIRNALKNRFPTIAMLLEVLKSIDHRFASWTLMTKETQLFLFEFVQNFYLNQAHYNIPIFTIHDCFITTKSNVDLLENEIKNFFLENYKVKIPLKREYY